MKSFSSQLPNTQDINARFDEVIKKFDEVCALADIKHEGTAIAVNNHFSWIIGLAITQSLTLLTLIIYIATHTG